MVIISKIELEGADSLKYTDVGFTTDEAVKNEINEGFDATLGKFLGENRTKLNLGEVSISVFFETTDHVNEARTEVDTVEGLGLVEITNVNDL
tara:strand:- start:2297 stop:2575 length:279 start_codon:yes stop_codon:yes gene_type:complete